MSSYDKFLPTTIGDGGVRGFAAPSTGRIFPAAAPATQGSRAGAWLAASQPPM